MEVSGEDEEINRDDLRNLLFLVQQNPTDKEIDDLFQQMDKNSNATLTLSRLNVTKPFWANNGEY